MEEGQPSLSSYAEVDSVSGTKASGNTDVGGLVGQGERAAIISSYVTGRTVMGGSNNVGGLVGYGIGATITTSYVQDVSLSGSNAIGGLLGQGQNAIVTSSYVGDGVTLSAASVGGNGNAGGLVGSGRDATIKTSYSAAGSISKVTNHGGLLGFGAIDPASSNSYWNSETSTITTGSVADKITGITTAQLQSLNSFYYGTWNDRCADGSRAWNFGTDMQYPALTCTPGGVVAQGFESNADGGDLVDPMGTDRDGDSIDDIMDIDDDGNGLIEIATADELNQIRYNLSGSGLKASAGASNNTNGCGGTLTGIDVCSGYELVANISLTNYTNWTPIGSCDGITAATSVKPEFCAPENKFFNTIFEGNGYTISDLSITNVEHPYDKGAGLFGAIGSDSIVRNVHIRSASISGGVKNVGLLVGYAHYGGANIINSSAGGEVTASDSNVGGLVGSGRDDHNGHAVVEIGSNIISSYVTGVSVSGRLRVGGLIGDGRGAAIASSYAEVDSVSGTRAVGNADVGGLIGRGERVAISSSYATGRTVMGGSNSVGGLLGYGISAIINDVLCAGCVCSWIK